MDRLTRAVDEVLQALTEPGRAPAYHYRQVKRLAEEWAPLYYALNRLQDARRAHTAPERTGRPSAEVDRHPQVHTHEVPSAPPAPEDEPVPWLVTVTAWGDPEQQRVAELMADDQWQFIGSDFLWEADDLTFITPLLRADRMHTEEDYRLAPWESVGGRYEPRRYTRHVTDWTADTEEHDHGGDGA